MKKPQAFDLQRITTVYHAAEDRFRLSGQLPSGHTVVLWMTHRLLLRLIPHLLAWQEKQFPGGGQFVGGMLGFSPIPPQPDRKPEQPVPARGVSYLIQSVDLNSDTHVISLVFKTGAARVPVEVARLALTPLSLRQWLDIVYDQWGKSGWAMTVWPGWIADADVPERESAKIVLH